MGRALQDVEDDSQQDGHYREEVDSQDEAGHSTARRSTRKSKKANKRSAWTLKGVEEVTWEMHCDHWHGLRARLVREGRLTAVWGDKVVTIKDLPVARQADGVLLFW